MQYLPNPGKLKQLWILFLIPILFALFIACDGQKNNIAVVDDDNEEEIDKVSEIDTTVDPYFIYEYEQTKFVPPAGKTLLIMGQTVEDIDDYMAKFSEDPIPGGWSAYWGVPEFKGITENYTNQNGATHNHQMLVERFPNTVIQSAMWMVGTWEVAKNTANGEYDEVIQQYSNWAKAINRPIYLRIGYEFDGPHNALDPVEYVNAYRHVVDLMRAEGVENVAFVWHSYIAPPYNNHPVSAWYPGDEYVDWVGISLFGLLYQGANLFSYGDAVMEFAKTHKKPVMVAEASPVSGILPYGTEAWDSWFVHFFSVCYNKNIKAISFINANWERYTFEGVDWKDARLTNNQQISDAWFMETNKSRYLKQSPDLFEQLGY